MLLACNSMPIGVSLPDTNFAIAAIPTGNLAVFFAAPLVFDKPAVSMQSAAVEGVATYQKTNLSVEVYASASAPTNCTPVPTTALVLCDSAGYSKIGKVNFASAATQNFRLEGGVIATAVNQGKVWLGMRMALGSILDLGHGDVRLSQMKAKLAVF